MSERLTKQGVRDLNSGKQRNSRRVPMEKVCFHDWKTFSDGLGWMGPGHGSTWEQCRRCKKVRGIEDVL